jgi:hypothetical protein
MALKTLVTEILIINWLEMVFLARVNGFRQKFAYEDPVIRIVDGQSTNVTPQVTAFCGANCIILIRLEAHRSHISELFGV